MKNKNDFDRRNEKNGKKQKLIRRNSKNRKM